MKDMAAAAEQIKLERLLNVEEASLDFIAQQPSEASHAFREQLNEFFYQRHQDAFHRLAGMSKLLPVKGSAKLATTLLGPVLSAGIAGELAPDRAAKLADKLPTKFLAKLSLYLDPSRAGAIVGAISDEHIVAVAKQLSEWREEITLARFVSVISEQALAQVIAEQGDDGIGLLHTGMYLEDKSQLDKLIRKLSDSQRQALFAAASEHGLWLEVLSLLGYLKADMQVEMANLAGALPAEVRDDLVQKIAQEGEWPLLLEALAVMDDDNQRRFVGLPVMQQADSLKAFAEQVKDTGMEQKLAPLMALLSDEQKAAIG